MNYNKQYLIQCINVHKKFSSQSGNSYPIENLNLNVQLGESVGIFGSSGSGKSTAIQLIGLIDRIDSGSILISGEKTENLNLSKRSEIIAKKIGFIYQLHHLLLDFTILENLILACTIAGIDHKIAKKDALILLEKIGLKDKINRMPTTLSGGERQRVAVARAIIKKPEIILADEPTGSLDSTNSDIVVDLLLELVAEQKSSLIMVTHNEEYMNKFTNIYKMKNGKLIKF